MYQKSKLAGLTIHLENEMSFLREFLPETQPLWRHVWLSGSHFELQIRRSSVQAFHLSRCFLREGTLLRFVSLHLGV